ncbi:MAG: efflux RND transporter permease subunit [Halothermotrichaceae bacterium]
MLINTDKINKFFKKYTERLIKYRYIVLIVFLTVLIFVSMGLTKLEQDSSHDSWYFEDDPIIVMENRFEETFGSTDMCAVHIKVDDVFEKKNLEKIKELSNELSKKAPLVDKVISLTNFDYVSGSDYGINVGNLIPEHIPAEKESLENLRKKAMAKPMIKNRMVSADSTETWVIVQLKKMPEDWRTDSDYLNYIQKKGDDYSSLYNEFNLETPVAPDYLIGGIVNKISNQQKYRILNPKTTGSPVMTYDEHQFINSESPRLLLIGIVVSMILLAVFLRSVRGVIFPIFTVGGAMVMTFGLQGHLQITLQSALMVIPLILGLAIAVGYSIHIFNFYKKHLLKTGKRKESVIYALEQTGWPLLFTSLTTICALMSFQFIEIRPLLWLGNTAAMMVTFTYLLIMIIYPIFLSFGKDIKAKEKKISATGSFLENLLVSLNEWIFNHSKSILIGFVIFTIVCITGLLQVEVNLNEEVTTGRKVPFVDRMFTIAESQIGSYSSYDIGIEFNKDNAAKNPANLKKLERLVDEVEKLPLTKKTTSILNSLKDINQVLNEGKPEYYKIPETRQMVAQSLLLYENAGGDNVDQWVDYNYKKLHVRVEVSGSDARQLVAEHKKIKKLGKQIFPDADVFVSGSLAKVSDMTLKISWGQIVSFLIALLIIAVLMMLVFGSVKIGLIGLIPNITPALVVGAIMGYFKIPLDFITATIMPMLMGLAVDDTIHFITHNKQEYKKYNNYNMAASNTFRTVGEALFMTSAVLVCNFSVFTTSISNLYRNCGILVSAGIIAALLADYLVTPVCLKYFKAFSKK